MRLNKNRGERERDKLERKGERKVESAKQRWTGRGERA
jgi:hypothetical protein